MHRKLMLVALFILGGLLLMKVLGPTQPQPTPGSTTQEVVEHPSQKDGAKTIAQSQFDKMVDNGEFEIVEVATDGLKTVAWGATEDGRHVKAELITGTQASLYERLHAADSDVTYRAVPYPTSPLAWLLPLLPWIIILAVIIWMVRRSAAAMNGQMNQGNELMKSQAKSAKTPDITLDDVGGIDYIKPQLRAWVPRLVGKGNLGRLGGEVPKGLLLSGPPGTGKTLTARALAGECNKVINELIRQGELPADAQRVKFLTSAGSEFVQMFVGVGAARVRDLFKDARDNSPCVIFLDEIDALGKRDNGKGFSGGNDERTSTLNQLLVEMDGFNVNEKVLVIAATNRPDMLDDALKRPGRFDQLITIPKPDLIGREQILDVLMRKRGEKAAQNRRQANQDAAPKPPKKPDNPLGIPQATGSSKPRSVPIQASKPKPAKVFEDGLTALDIARVCIDQTGAEMEEVLNRAAQTAEMEGAEFIGKRHVEKAFDDVLLGPEMPRSMELINTIAITLHEAAGHGIVGWYFNKYFGDLAGDPVSSATIIARSMSLGHVMSIPEKDYALGRSKAYYRNKIAMTTGGRLAEILYMGPDNESPGAANDIHQATQMATAMVTAWGMSDKIGFRSCTRESLDGSHAMDELVQEEVKAVIDQQYKLAEAIILAFDNRVPEICRALLNKKTLSGEEFARILEGDLQASGDKPDISDFLNLDPQVDAEFTKVYQAHSQARQDRINAIKQDQEFADYLKAHHPVVAQALNL